MSAATTHPDEHLEHILHRAAQAAAAVAAAPVTERARWLRTIADHLDSAADPLVAVAVSETHLSRQRLTRELARTTFQLRLTASVVEEGSWQEICVDHADPQWPTGPRPDLRRVLRPVGPVLAVTAGNFPFAFGVAGADTASAIGAGCPAIVKAHPGYPTLAHLTAEHLLTALDAEGAPTGTFAMIDREDHTREALNDPRVKAGSFTGSTRGGRALFDIASSRPDPIPFYGELGSVNPAFILPSALAAARLETLTGFVDSFTGDAGQLCTKPGLIFVPRAARVLDDLARLVTAKPAAEMLNDRMTSTYRAGISGLDRAFEPVTDPDPDPDSIGVRASLWATSIEAAGDDLAALQIEHFGPAAVVVEYDSTTQLNEIAQRLDGQLTVSVHGHVDDPAAGPLLAALTERAGRLLWNDWPTGVSVTWAMHHGGPWPATTGSLHTSVGPTGLRRFQRPITYQNVPQALLPRELTDDRLRRSWRRVDGDLVPPEAAAADAC